MAIRPTSANIKDESIPKPRRARLDVSLIVPVYNERDNLPLLLERIHAAMAPLGLSYETLFIDDGSTDGSAAVLRELTGSDPRARLLEFVRNFGQTAAIAAGFEHSQGDVVIPLDADLQNDPADIPQILDKLADGFDVVSCWRRDRKDSWTRVLPSRVANRLISWISGVRLHDYGCTLKGYRRRVVRHIRLYGEMHRFIPIFASWAGARVTEIAVNHHPRHSGRSKYGFIRTFKVPLDLITIKFLGSFSTKPMYLFGGVAFGTFVLGALLSVATLAQKLLYGVKAHRNPLLLLSIFFFLVGVQFVLFGLMCELIVRTYHESQGKPTYILRSPLDEEPEEEGE